MKRSLIIGTVLILAIVSIGVGISQFAPNVFSDQNRYLEKADKNIPYSNPDFEQIQNIIENSYTLTEEIHSSDNVDRIDEILAELSNYFVKSNSESNDSLSNSSLDNVDGEETNENISTEKENGLTDEKVQFLLEQGVPVEVVEKMCKKKYIPTHLKLDSDSTEFEKLQSKVEEYREAEKSDNYGRHNFSIDNTEYKRVKLSKDSADVIVDIYSSWEAWSKNPDGSIQTYTLSGGQQITYSLRKIDGMWKIEAKRDLIIPGTNP